MQETGAEFELRTKCYYITMEVLLYHNGSATMTRMTINNESTKTFVLSRGGDTRLLATYYKQVCVH